ncbi:hypothetical protein AGMMS49587_15240 [Spirochaetia bacterium]|nr:hypothetical protein AGMMS49587_15240 [Spirochaetia bacterium]
MMFYDIDSALEEAIAAGDKPVRLRIDIDWGDHFETIREQDIAEASFEGLKEEAGGTSARGEVLLENPEGRYSIESANNGSGREVRIYFSLGEGLPWFLRFYFFVDDNGFQDIQGPGRKRQLRLGLLDLSYRLRKTDESRDWKNPVVFTYAVICDKTQPEKSLVHLIFARLGIPYLQIDCSTILLTLPYVKLSKNIWAELSALAKAYRCHLECATEKPLVFAHSPYQSEFENPYDSEISYTFTGENSFYLRKSGREEKYRNTVRLKINLPVAMEKQEIWRYEDAPVLYTDELAPYYPFRDSIVREIEGEGYEAEYSIKDVSGKIRPVVYASEIDTQEEAESRIVSEGSDFAYAKFDTTSHHDKALVQLAREGDGDLSAASIYGKPIVLDLNTSCFKRNEGEIASYGTAALNVTGSYFSSDEVDGVPQYEDWTNRELADRMERKKEFTVKTHRGIFHARVGAIVMINTKEVNTAGTVTALSLRYKKNAAFVATVKIKEELPNG